MTKRGSDSPVVLSDLREMADSIIAGINGMWKKIDKRFEKVDERFDGVEQKLGNVEERLGHIETEVKYIKNDVRDLKADTPTSGEFNKLKARVDRYVGS